MGPHGAPAGGVALLDKGYGHCLRSAPCLRTRHAARDPRELIRASLGQECTLVRAAAPRGQVKVSGEIWSARSRFGDKLPAGMAVRVVDAEGIVLIVEPARRGSS
jgi:membrane protein implicated in regulation of membrane protease activity